VGKSIPSFAVGTLTFLKQGPTSVGFSGCVSNKQTWLIIDDIMLIKLTNINVNTNYYDVK